MQIAPYSYGDEASDVLPKFWEAQTAALEIPHTGMVVIHDVGDLNDIHPKNKQEVGRRLALVALAKTYNQAVSYSGPLYRSMEIKGDKIHLRFDHGGGLKTRDGAAPDHFEVIDQERGGFVRANAKIVGDEVVVSAPGVANPVAVRFAWHKLAEPNLINAAGLPAAPFPRWCRALTRSTQNGSARSLSAMHRATLPKDCEYWCEISIGDNSQA